MRPIPIPDGVAEVNGGRRVIYTAPGGDMLDDDVRPVEAIVIDDPVDLVQVAVLIELDDDDRAAAAAGLPIWLSFKGGMPIWGISFADPAAPAEEG